MPAPSGTHLMGMHTRSQVGGGTMKHAANSSCYATRAARTLLIAFFAVALLASHSVVADSSQSPEIAKATLKQISKEMVAGLQEPSVRQNVNEIRELVERLLVPHIDFRVSSNLVLGPHWTNASESQRSAFIDEFRAFLVRFYVGALASYVDSSAVPTDVMRFDEEPRVKNDRRLSILSKVGQANGEMVPVEYRMFYRESWKLIDVSVAGISIVQSYRSNFNSTVKRQGLDVLIAQLHERNSSFAAN